VSSTKEEDEGEQQPRSDKEVEREAENTLPLECVHTLKGHSSLVWTMDSDGSIIVSGGFDGNLVVWKDTQKFLSFLERTAVVSKSLLWTDHML
jgi:WD40 repeat protein